MASFGGLVGQHGGADAHVVAVGDRNDVLENGLLMATRAQAATDAFLAGGANRDVEHRERGLAGARHGDGDFRRATRWLGPVDRHQNADLAVWLVLQLAARCRDRQRTVEAPRDIGDALVEFLAAFGCFLQSDDQQVVTLLGLLGDEVGTGCLVHDCGDVKRGIDLLLLVLLALNLFGIIGFCYLVELFIAPVEWGSAVYHSIKPEIADPEALLISVGIIGATVMPHAIYLHSGLTQSRTPAASEGERRQLVRYSNIEVIIALAIAGLINMAMVMMASGAFHAGHPEVSEIETAYHTLAPLLGIGAAGIFLLSLIASGISSSVVGTMAGQMIMQGFVGFRIPIWLRRVVTMVPAFVVVALGVNATNALVASQVVLSIALPLPMITLLIFTGRADIMGDFANGRLTRVAAIVATMLVLTLNVFLLAQTFGVSVPGLGN